MLSVQFKRLFYSKYFYLSLIIGSLIAIFQYAQITSMVFADLKDRALSGHSPAIPDSSYLLWMYSSLSEIANLSLVLLPILAVIPYGIQLLTDRKTNYAQLMIMKAGKHRYLFSMLAVSAAAGFLVIVLPLLLNFLLFAITFPSIAPNQFLYYMYSPGSYQVLFFDLHQSFPFLHTMIYITLAGLVGGFFAMFATSLGLIVRFQLLLVVVPLLFTFILSMIDEFLQLSLAPYDFLHMVNALPTELFYVYIFFGLLLLGTAAFYGIGVRNIGK
ncbi:hypothetical protein ACFOZ1_08655 [Gracilibacillus marinus]|uniref:ABC-2 family transporter protein n=1 Tax=Gracilibacillus marinus TaxID=630535 RepID=A0ABV8VXY0_9BACI